MDRETSKALDRLVAAWPPLSEAQRATLACLLSPANPWPDMFPCPRDTASALSDERKAELRRLFYSARGQDEVRVRPADRGNRGQSEATGHLSPERAQTSPDLR
jgi:hypothetical protein